MARGGKRPGAGRPASGRPTAVLCVRIPAALLENLRERAYQQAADGTTVGLSRLVTELLAQAVRQDAPAGPEG